MFQCCTKVVPVVCATLRTPNKKNMIFFSQVLVFAWYFAVFLVRTPYTAADTLTAGAGGAPHVFLTLLIPLFNHNAGTAVI